MELENLNKSNSRDSEPDNQTRPDLFRRDISIPGPLWNTLEFYIYYVLFLIVVPYMMYGVVQLSSDHLPNYQSYKDRLKQGWMFNRKFDNSDHQYSQFRNNIPILTGVAIGYIVLSKLVQGMFTKPRESIPKFWTNFTPAKSYFYLLFNTVFLSVLHGSSVLKLFGILLINFYLTKLMGKFKWSPAISFIFNFAVLILADLYEGFKFSSFSDSLSFLDKYEGIVPRWFIHFNITTLRLISWSFDYHWSLTSSDKIEDYKTELNTNKLRANQNSPLKSFNLVNYFAYILYAPLYLAGPIITYNDWYHQVKNGNKNITKSLLIKRGLNLLGCMLLMEWMLHYVYVMAISKKPAYQGYSPFELTMVGFFNLKFIWLKLLVIWRFFRYWSLLDGIEPIENMGRCMSNNYSIQGFWKGWHCSYNRWIVRYMYIPLGGAKYPYLNIWPIFTFVAIWHDTSFQLLAWGWLISLFFIPELLAVQLTKPLRRKKYFRHLKAAGGALNVFALCAANLVGFALGTEGVQKLIRMLSTMDGLLFLIITYACLFVGVQLMIEIRNSELRAYHRNRLRNSD